MADKALIENTDRGLYCEAGRFYIDAWRPVDVSVVTHAHADHARRGCGQYFTSAEGSRVLQYRMGADAKVAAWGWGEAREMNGVQVSLHPAGHVLGAGQIRVEYRGEVWVVTGDYKRQADATCSGFEVVKCDTLVTECTFGLPIFKWKEPAEVAGEINRWWRKNVEAGRTSMMLAYSFGKTQRVLSLLDPSIGPILLHGAAFAITQAYRESGVALPEAEHASVENAKKHKGKALVICPPAAAGSTWARKFGAVSIGAASGWMQVRGFRRRKAADAGFVLSDHADWEALLRTIDESGAKRVIATHGYTAQLSRYLKEKGVDAGIYQTRFTDSGEEDEAPDEAQGGTDGAQVAEGGAQP